MLSRRLLLASLTSSALALSMAAPTLAHAQDKVIKVGTLKLIHGITPYFYDKFTPAGYKIEVIPFETPTDGKNAVVTKSVDFGTYGLAAATLGAAAGGPVVIVAPTCNGGMAVVVGKDSGIGSFKELKGKRVYLAWIDPRGRIQRSFEGRRHDHQRCEVGTRVLQ